MNRQRLITVLVIAGGLISLGISQAFASIATYRHAAPCGQVTGFAGLLQTAGFIPQGDCVVNVKKGGCQSSSACTITNPPSGTSAKGQCTPSADKQSCSCMAKYV